MRLGEGLTTLTYPFYANYVLRDVLKRWIQDRIQDEVCQRGVGRLIDTLPAKMMAKQLRIVQLNVSRLEETGWKTTHKGAR